MRRIPSLFFIASLALLVLPLAFSATLTVKQDGSGNAKTIQEALNAAKNGDTIVIGDSGKYVEDLTASPVLVQLGIPAANLSSFTLKAADGMKPVIQAANAESSQRMIGLGLPGRDMLGFVIWGCKGVTVQGIEIVNLENVVNAFKVESSLVIVDCDTVTVENCTLRGPNAKSSNEGSAMLIAGIQAQPYLTDNIVVRNCLVTESHYGIISAVFQKGSGADPNRVTIENCQIVNGFESAIDVDNALQMTIRNCTMTNYNHGVHFAGANTLVEDCTILNSKNVGLDADIDTTWTDKITGVIVRRCAIIGSGLETEAPGIRCADGPSRFENCIIAGSSGPGISIEPDSESDVAAVFDHCDVYENLGLAEIWVKAGQKAAQVTIANSNVVSSGSGILNDLDLSVMTAKYNNVFVKGDAYINVDAKNSIAKDPLYVSPTNDPAQFALGDFKLQDGSPVLKAGENGSAIGSQGTSVTGIKPWRLY